MDYTLNKRALGSLILLTTCLVLTLLPELAFAALDIQKPSFIDTRSAQDIDAAGDSITGWISIAFGVVAGIAGAIASFFAMNGKMEEMWERFKNVLIGVVLFSVSGSIIFGLV